MRGSSSDASSAGPSSHLVDAVQREQLQPSVGPDEARDELVGGVREHGVRRVVLGEDAALAEDRDPVADANRLVDVVRDEDDGLPHGVLQARNSSCSRARVIGSRAPKGSSMSSTFGSPASARAMPTRWRWPPESCAG